eukprot:g6716.t1
MEGSNANAEGAGGAQGEVEAEPAKVQRDEAAAARAECDAEKSKAKDIAGATQQVMMEAVAVVEVVQGATARACAGGGVEKARPTATEEAAGQAGLHAPWAEATPEKEAPAQAELEAAEANASAEETHSHAGGALSTHLLDFGALRKEKESQLLPGTREWIFDLVDAWLRDPGAARLFWLMGGAGTGKSVVAATWLRRNERVAAAWHFFRHDDPGKSEPAALLASLAAMLATKVPAFGAALEEQEGVDAALDTGKPAEIFRVLLHEPLARTPAPDRTLVIVLDALDEVPRARLLPLLDVIATELRRLPGWLRLFITSREEHHIKVKLRAFAPTELRVDEERNRQDVRAYLAHIARHHVEGLDAAGICAKVQAEFGVDLGGEAAGTLESLLVESKQLYDAAVAGLEREEGYGAILEMAEVRPEELRQDEAPGLDALLGVAARAQAALTGALAAPESWEPLNAHARHIKEGAPRRLGWVEDAVDPGIKQRESAQRKADNDMGGDVRGLTDVSRLTLKFDRCANMAQALRELRGGGVAGWEVVEFKNKYANPTPLGYRDINTRLRLTLEGGARHIAEVQLNFECMLRAKDKGHGPYEEVREMLPEICKAQGHSGDWKKVMKFIVGLLDSSALDGAIRTMVGKAGGLFIYARLLEEALAAAGAGGAKLANAAVEDLPAGLDEMYAGEFERSFPGGAGWAEAKELVELVAAAQEPLPVAAARRILRWGDGEQEAALGATALLFPVREGRLHVLHKSVTDWLGRDKRHAWSVDVRAGHRRLRDDCAATIAERGGGDAFSLRHFGTHAVRCGARGAEDRALAEATLGSLRVVERAARAGLVRGLVQQLLALGSAEWEGGKSRVLAEFARFVRSTANELAGGDPRAVYGLAANWPDGQAPAEAARRMLESGAPEMARVLLRVAKPQRMDACVLTLEGHTHEVTSCAFSADGAWVVTASGDGTARIWAADTGELRATLEGHTDWVTSCAFSADGAWVVTASGDKTARIWAADTGELRATLEGHTSSVNSCAFSADGAWVVTASGDKTARIWAADTGELRATLEGHTSEVTSCAFSADGAWVVTAGSDKTARLWAADTGELRATLEGHTEGVTSCAFSADGAW